MHDQQDEDAAWQRLGELLLARRVELGWRRRAPFARHLGLTHDRTLADIELARRKNFDQATLLFLERGYGWEPNSIKAVLAGGEPTVTEPNPGPQVQVDQPSVRGDDEGREPYLTRQRPDYDAMPLDELQQHANEALEALARRARDRNPDAAR